MFYKHENLHGWLDQLVNFIITNCTKTPDIFRAPGALAEIKKIKEKVNEAYKQPPLDFLEPANCGRIVAPIFKIFYGSFQYKLLDKETSDIMQFTLGKLKLFFFLVK